MSRAARSEKHDSVRCCDCCNPIFHYTVSSRAERGTLRTNGLSLLECLQSQQPMEEPASDDPGHSNLQLYRVVAGLTVTLYIP